MFTEEQVAEAEALLREARAAKKAKTLAKDPAKGIHKGTGHRPRKNAQNTHPGGRGEAKGSYRVRDIPLQHFGALLRQLDYTPEMANGFVPRAESLGECWINPTTTITFLSWLVSRVDAVKPDGLTLPSPAIWREWIDTCYADLRSERDKAWEVYRVAVQDAEALLQPAFSHRSNIYAAAQPSEFEAETLFARDLAIELAQRQWADARQSAQQKYMAACKSLIVFVR